MAKAKKKAEVLSPSEITKQLKASGKELFEAKMKNKLGQLSNPLVIRKMRKDIARLETMKTQVQAK
ncbi:MAG: 50S ribosomal protein L29 [Pseudobdellovibrionaceae bacterium]|jgi:large subunit ribosomal protein L29